jgi:hypothetical protein
MPDLSSSNLLLARSASIRQGCSLHRGVFAASQAPSGPEPIRQGCSGCRVCRLYQIIFAGMLPSLYERLQAQNQPGKGVAGVGSVACKFKKTCFFTRFLHSVHGSPFKKRYTALSISRCNLLQQYVRVGRIKRGKYVPSEFRGR